MKDLYRLSDDLPIPEDDGTCNHLLSSQLPSVLLKNTSGKEIDIGSLQGMVVLFFYPMNGSPDFPPMIGWNEIPGARGCTPQSCSYRDNYSYLEGLDFQVFGISTQPLVNQKEVHKRLNLPFELLNDSEHVLTKAMRLPTFDYHESTYIKRLTIVAKNGIIKKHFSQCSHQMRMFMK